MQKTVLLSLAWQGRCLVIALHTHVTNKSGAYQVTHDIFSMIAIRSGSVHTSANLIFHFPNKNGKKEILGVSWCCGNYCLLAFVLWCGYCSVSFQSFVLRHWCPQHQETTEILLILIIFTYFKVQKKIEKKKMVRKIDHFFIFLILKSASKIQKIL